MNDENFNLYYKFKSSELGIKKALVLISIPILISDFYQISHPISILKFQNFDSNGVRIKMER